LTTVVHVIFISSLLEDPWNHHLTGEMQGPIHSLHIPPRPSIDRPTYQPITDRFDPVVLFHFIHVPIATRNKQPIPLSTLLAGVPPAPSSASSSSSRSTSSSSSSLETIREHLKGKGEGKGWRQKLVVVDGACVAVVGLSLLLLSLPLLLLSLLLLARWRHCVVRLTLMGGGC
jgi:hypothetical protein